MKRVLYFLIIIMSLSACNEGSKIPVFVWMGGPGNSTDAELISQFDTLKMRGVDGVMYNGGHDPATYARVGKIVKKAGMEFHTWIPTMVQSPNPKIDSTWYAINGNGDSAFDKPVYVAHYKFLCPNKVEVQDYLADLYGKVAEVDEVDGIHLDYIRFPDVILARGLWDKYGLVMDKEYPTYDYCYCDKCVADFKAISGVDIKTVEDPSQNAAWVQFRYDLITNMVSRLATVVHGKDKKINGAVFPGPSISKKLVRQEWDKWDLDAYFPMNYNDFYLEDAAWVGEMVKEEVAAVKGEKPIYSGLFICPDPAAKASQPDPENHGLIPSELAEAIEVSMRNGATGICLFTPGRMTDEHWKVFEEAIYKDYSN